MNILHVLSQYEITGAETYAVSLAESQLKSGDRVWIVSDTLSTPTSIPFTQKGIGKRRWPQRVANIWFLRRLIQTEKIDIVHAHSRAASWVAYFAAKGTKAALISTVHGRQHIHRSSKGLDIYGDRVIAVCANLKTHLTEELGLKPEKIHVIPNGFDFAKFNGEWTPESHRELISIIGRPTGPKGWRTGLILDEVFAHLLRENPRLHVQIIGGELERFAPESQNRIRQAMMNFPGRVELPGFINDITPAILNSLAVIGAGRVGLHSLALGTPLIAVGESLAIGLVTPENLDEVLSSNLGDCASTNKSHKPDNQILLAQLRELLQRAPADLKSASLKISRVIRERYAIDHINSEVREVYYQARAKKNWPKPIPVLMYHKVPEVAIQSPHKTFVVREIFEKQMASLKSRGFQTLTFSDYQDFRSGARSAKDFPKRPIILTFDDGYRDNLENALPVLKKHGFRAVIYLLGDSEIDHNIWDTVHGDGRCDLMTLDEKRQMLASGMELGAHSMNHIDLTRISLADAENEIRNCKARLEADFGLPHIFSFAYPYGYFNEQIKNLVRKVGFHFAVATDRGGLHLEDDVHEIFRVNMFPQDIGFRYLKKSSWWYRYYYRFKRGV